MSVFIVAYYLLTLPPYFHRAVHTLPARSYKFLWLFTVSGIQGPVNWLPADPITIISRDCFVAVFYHAAAGPQYGGTQSLGYFVWDGLTGVTLMEGRVAALSAGSKLA